MRTSEQIAVEWGLSKNTINEMCSKGKIPGVVKEGRKWLIPDDAVRPADGRMTTGKYSKPKNTETKPLPIGISDYVRAQSEYYYVDKTLLIKEFLDKKPL
ncbi:MAG: helix-turn-helix domain-containing protein, partial [Eubacteriales bacterium]|nr:helix-turn-helix domain-containing protein [Eubacteriales bacterium]